MNEINDRDVTGGYWPHLPSGLPDESYPSAREAQLCIENAELRVRLTKCQAHEIRLRQEISMLRTALKVHRIEL